MAPKRTEEQLRFLFPAVALAGSSPPMCCAPGLSRPPVRAAPEFNEVGAGIQLGPNVFRMFEKIGLKDES